MPVRIRERFSQSSTTDSSSSSLTSASVSAASPAPSFAPAGHHHHPVSALGSPQMLQQPHLNGAAPALHLSANLVSQSSPQMVPPGQSFVPAYSQAFSSNQSLQPPASSSFGGYSGVYSEAPPLPQPVAAHALQRPPLPVSVKPPTSSAFLATLTKAQSNSLQDKYAEKQPAQRRKFKEYPIAGKDASGDEQVGRAELGSRLVCVSLRR